jgi:hypothetical protein
VAAGPARKKSVRESGAKGKSAGRLGGKCATAPQDAAHIIPEAIGSVSSPAATALRAAAHLTAQTLAAAAVLASLLGHAHALAGDRGEALKTIDRLREQATRHYVPAFNLALVYVGLGEKDMVLDAQQD